MSANYFTLARRNLFRNKGFSLINVLGLTIGMTCTALILLWVKDELTYDRFHANYRQIYQVIANRDFNNQIFTDRNMVLPMAAALEARCPQVQRAAVTTYSQTRILAWGDKKLTKNGYTVSEHFFDLFSWACLKGNARRAIADPSNILLTQSAAKSLFGNADPINQLVTLDNQVQLKVAAVLADPPGNSSFRFDFIDAFNYSDSNVIHSMNEWNNSSWNVFLQVRPEADLDRLTRSVNAIKKEHSPEDHVSTYFLFPMSRWRLYGDFANGRNTGGMIEYVRLFTIVAAIILLIACINFMNLSTARSEHRAREVGIRKTLGSAKGRLILQFYAESLILSFVAWGISLVLLYLLLSPFNLLVGKDLLLQPGEPLFWAAGFGICLLTGLVAGSYPALYLSSFNPIQVLKGTFRPGRKMAMPRHILVVAQFVISAFLISATLIVYEQIQHVKSRDMGYHPNDLIMIPSTVETDGNYPAIKQELLKTGLIDGVTRMGNRITDIQWRAPAPDWEGKPANQTLLISGMTTDLDFARTIGVRLREGHDFTGMPSDSNAVLINQSAVQSMGLKRPIGTLLRYDRAPFHVIGVLENIVMESPYEPVIPMMVYFNNRGSGQIHVRLKAGVQPQLALPSLQKVFKKYNPAYPFEYRFADQEFGKKFHTEELIGRISDVFAALAIFICCLGLAGLASYTMEKRMREISIRKVLGASIVQLLRLISREFLILVFIALMLAIPLTWWLMNRWLRQYNYRISLSLWPMLSVCLALLFLTLAVVWLNTLQAALRNPVKSLRTE